MERKYNLFFIVMVAVSILMGGCAQNIGKSQDSTANIETSNLQYNDKAETSSSITTTDTNEFVEISSEEAIEILTITGNQYPVNLSEIDIHVENDEDIIELSKMTQLEKLKISMYYHYPDLTPLTKFVNLYELEIGDGGVGISLDIRVLEEMKSLEKLTISTRELPDISSLAKLKNIKELSLIGLGLSDINPLTELNNLEYLKIASPNRSVNSLVDISPLVNLTNITYLNLLNNEIADINPLSGLINLTYLNLSNNPIDDIFLLKNLKNLENLIIGGYYPIEAFDVEELKILLPDCTITLLMFLDNSFSEIVYNND